MPRTTSHSSTINAAPPLMPRTAREVLDGLISLPKARARVQRLKDAVPPALTDLELEAATAEVVETLLPVPIGMVPVTEQLTDAEQQARRRRDGLLRAVKSEPNVTPLTEAEAAAPQPEPALEGEIVAFPWLNWTDPEIRTYDLSTLHVQSTTENKLLIGDLELAGSALPNLGYQAGFPAEFIEKLPAPLAAAVINDRIRAAKPHDVNLVIDGGRATQITTGNRQVMSARRVAELTYDFMQAEFGAADLSRHSFHEGDLHLLFETSLEAPITRAVGDILKLGVVVNQKYGEPLEVFLHAKRLVCLNGMTANRRICGWKVQEQRTREAQENWLREAIGGMRLQFDQLQERSRLMAATRFQGDYVAVLGQTARAMRLPQRHMAELIAAYELEPGDTQYHLLNAITRVATHNGLPLSLARRMMTTAGDWALNFSLCQAELPRFLAQAVGARIIAEG